ncbi:MAG: hypothetical protein IJV04_03780 [Lachnospiraceae bacterium]|nr:hypothetical protein [Lachnospiraceae bacterium]
MSAISDINIRINSSLESIIPFDPEVKHYSVEVPVDCFALKVHVDYDPAYYIRVTTDHDAGRYMSPELDPEMGDYIAGSEVPYYEYYDGYIVRLDKRRDTLQNDLQMKIWISAGSYELGNETYEIDLKRPCNTAIKNKFIYGSHEDGEFGVRVPYALYVPSDYDPKKTYPIVVCLHGTGERLEPLEAILEKMEMATAWARDSEKGVRQCLVLVPQCLIHYDDEDNWTSLVQYINGHSNSPFWPLPQLKAVWNLIGKLEKEYCIDPSRRYLTGISSGGFGAYALALEHPGAFAGAATASCAANMFRIEELRGLPMWFFHADDDPLIKPSFTLDPTIEALEKAGIEYRLTRYPKGMVFWQSAHFVW